MSIENTLAERETRYGSFDGHASISQGLKAVITANLSLQCLDKIQHYHAEAVDMICHKLARIANGDPDYIDNWHDIAGYATLVENILLANEAAAEHGRPEIANT